MNSLNNVSSINNWVEYGIVLLILLIAAYYVWHNVLFKKNAKCGSGCGKCGS